MATIDWPTSDAFKPLDMQVGISAPGATWTAPYGGPTQRVSLLNDKLTARFSLPPLIDKAAAGQREALLFGIKSAGDIVRLHHWARPYPNGTLRGSPTVNGSVLAGARSVTLASALPASMLFVGDFETDSNADGLCDGWTDYNAGSTTGRAYVHSTVAQSGTKSQRVQATVLGGSSSDRVGIWRKVTVPASAIGSTVTLSAYMQRDSAHTASAQLHISWRNSGNSEISTTSQSVAVATSLTRYSVSGTVPSGTVSADVFIWFHSRTGNSVVFESNIDAVQLELAASASAFAGLASVLGGDMLSVGGKLLQVAYAGATADDAGAMTVPLSLATRAAISNGAAVTWDKPTSTWEIIGIDPQLEYRGGGLQLGPEITLVEA